MMKAAVCFYQVVGYGKKHVSDENMINRINKHQIDLQHLQQELKIPLSQISEKEQKLQTLFEKERRLKRKVELKMVTDFNRIRIRKLWRPVSGTYEKFNVKLKRRRNL